MTGDYLLVSDCFNCYTTDLYIDMTKDWVLVYFNGYTTYLYIDVTEDRILVSIF